jgi:hypothetical protein
MLLGVWGRIAPKETHHDEGFEKQYRYLVREVSKRKARKHNHTWGSGGKIGRSIRAKK